MKNKMMKNSLIAGLILVMLVSSVSGYGVLSEFSSTRPMEISPGESLETYLEVQNTGGEVTEDIAIEVELLDDAGVASIGESRYDVKAKETVRVPIYISVLEDVVLGQSYNVKYKVSQVAGEDEEGAVTFGVSYEGRFNVAVVEEEIVDEPGPTTNIWLWAIGIIVLILIIWLVLRRKKQN